MSAVDAYAAYLRKQTGTEPETVSGKNTLTLTARHEGAALTVTFRPAAGSRLAGWHPATIVLTRSNGSVTGFAVGQISRAVADLLRGGVPAELAAPEKSTA